MMIIFLCLIIFYFSWTPLATNVFCVVYPSLDTILTLFKSQEEAFGAPVQKMNLRGQWQDKSLLIMFLYKYRPTTAS